VKRVLLFLLLTAMVAFVSTFTLAQTARGRKAPRKPPKAAPVEADGGATRSESRGEAQGTFQPDAGVTASKTLEGGAKAYRFGEMEIEGRLKSPQIVYFLRRVRAEFAAEDLGHRPFLQELSETKKDPAF
jgi:hypothetical protein